MSHFEGRDELILESVSLIDRHRSLNSSSENSTRENDADEVELQWAAIERLPTFERLRFSLSNNQRTRMVDVTKLGALERHELIEKLIKHIENDNRQLLQKLKERIDRVNVRVPTVEVRCKNLCVEAECEVVEGKPLPTLWNSAKSTFSATGEITYNDYELGEFVPQKTSAYISQHDLHIPEMTVRETLDFSARCQGVGSRAEIMMDVIRREKQEAIVPEPDIDTYMKATSIEGLEKTLQTDYILKILGLDICADTMVGDAMRRGISGGQKKRLTTGEMIVGPMRALFMDGISNGLDSSTTFQIISCLQQLVHITEATALISLLQPAPETYDLFDDIILIADGKIVYHGPRSDVLKYFEDCGFRCPERKGVADFLQEVISKKDQAQYWYHIDKPYGFISVDQFSEKFRESCIGQKLDEELSKPYDMTQYHKSALSFSVYSLPKWELFKACMTRELLLMKRNAFVYIFNSTRLLIIALVTMTVFLRTQMHIDLVHANYRMGSLFYALMILMLDGIPELSMTVSRLAVFYKQRDFYFYPAWAYAIPASILKIPVSLVQSLVWTVLTYYVIGYSPEAGRFFCHFLLLFALHQMSMSMFRFTASIFQTMSAALMGGNLFLLFFLLFGGYILPRSSIPSWLHWGFWLSPLTYGEIGMSVNEFLAPRWQKDSFANTTIGNQVLISRGLNFGGYFYWISLGALVGFSILFNIGFTLALTFLQSPGISRAIISHEKLSQLHEREDHRSSTHLGRSSTSSLPPETVKAPKRVGRMVLPFVPLTMAFQDVWYCIDTPLEMRERGFPHRKLRLLHDITGAFRPGVLTALMGVSGAGKTTLMDVLSGRKTAGTIKGDIRIGGYPKVQETFARISGYCEQTDIHSPQITIKESVIYSAWLRLPCQIDSSTKAEFVAQVLEMIELDGIKDNLVGIPGVSGLSTEQRKRLTIAVELVSNPSIIFMDEPTSGLDARAAAIVMRAVKNIGDTGRTVVCTIHQPSIDIFESFDELILMKRGGEITYAGPLGPHSSTVIEYFEGISGVRKIKDNYNPATWMLEVTATAIETQLGVDFAHIYRASSLYKDNKELVMQLSSPPSGSTDLHFPTRYSENSWGQFKACLWKQSLSYWRSPAYNLIRLMFTISASTLFGLLFWQHGKKIDDQQDLLNMLGAMFSAMFFVGLSNCSLVLPFIGTERTVLYRERFAGMYSSWAYSFAQVAIEIPYVFVQALVLVSITYPAIGYYWSASKILWYFYAIFCTLLYFSYLGMLIMALSPNVQVASILASSGYTMLNLFSGFLIPGPQFPKWWYWCYWISPTSWSLKCLFTSQYGDISKEITAFDEIKAVDSFLESYLGFYHDSLGIMAIVLAALPVAFAFLFAHRIAKLNFQRR
ncbi:pleiotropic drug resistance protein 3-like isoform X2 [Magnolia sinica]|uniref:pleiotropic drug resistance protein 3-like isoform X2 n=1 Tax=Magnolia sinica TaxID=86752 RepID=UPI0026588231|nr:pleiotropic drug resistance protein 3-like isoform X2 [Magnolia sinica]